MPFKLHPSGYCTYYEYQDNGNLKQREPCPVCRRVAGHSHTCINFVYDETKGKSSRPKLFDAAAVLWARYQEKSFITFTLPSLDLGVYQSRVSDDKTGDLAIGRAYSKTLEAWSIAKKRSGSNLSYVWVAEAQMKRKARYGGIGDIHYHLMVNHRLKSDKGRVVDPDTLQWLQDLWCKHVGVEAKNCVDVQPIPDSANCIPAYLSKYMGKGTQRMIMSRRFAATRDLTRFKPVDLVSLPDADLIRTVEFTTPSGHVVQAHYYNTRQVLESYGAAMIAEHDLR